jgi:hypothetical protein
MMLAMCLATVAGLMTSSSAMALLLRPSATSAEISSSRGVSELGGVAAATAGAGPAGAAGGSSAVPIAASGVSAAPRAHSAATSSPRRRAGAR